MEAARSSRGWRATVLASAIAAVCLAPWVARLRHPSVYADDIDRIALLHTMTWREQAIVPFNEHLAPLFQTVSYLAWNLAGRRLGNAPWAFTIASVLPFVAALGILAWLLRRELNSGAAAAIGVIAFAITPVYAEAVLWYSASSFMWALLGVLLAWLGAAEALRGDGRPWGWWMLAVIAAMLAPACSGLGLLAGPLAALRVLLGHLRPDGAKDRESEPLAQPHWRASRQWHPMAANRQEGTERPTACEETVAVADASCGSAARTQRRPGHPRATRGTLGAFLFWPLIPLLGTAAYLTFAFAARYREILGRTLHQPADGWTSLIQIARATAGVLVPGLVGMDSAARKLGPTLALGLFAIGLVAVFLWAVKSRNRPILLGALALVLGSYGLTYPARYGLFGPNVILVQRYHLFAQMGLAWLIAAGAASVFPKVRISPSAGLGIALALAIGSFLLHEPAIRIRERYLRFPEQRQALAAISHLEQFCRRQGITRAQALAALDPVRPRWYPLEGNALVLLPPTVREARVPDAAVRPLLLHMLSHADLAGLCGGVDPSAHLVPAETLVRSQVVAEARLVDRWHVQPAEAPGQFSPVAEPAYLEFELSTLPEPASALIVPTAGPNDRLELWWTSTPGTWPPSQTAVWHPAAESATAWALPLDRLPHWDPGRERRVRILFRTAGPSAVGAPRLVR